LRTSFPIKLVLFGLLALIVVSVATAFAAGPIISSSNADEKSIPVHADDLRPSACAAGYSPALVLMT